MHIHEEPVEARTAAGGHGVHIGGFNVLGRHAVLTVSIDNLLKGAATQAIQNVNLAMGFDEFTGLYLPSPDDMTVDRAQVRVNRLLRGFLIGLLEANGR